MNDIHLLYKCLSLIKSFIRDDIADIIIKVLIGFYVFSIPYNISLYRAFYMLVIYDLVKEKFNQLDVLSFLVLVNVIKNPYIIFSISFVFSYFIAQFKKIVALSNLIQRIYHNDKEIYYKV